MDKASPNLSAASKSASLPGYTNRGFHGAVYSNSSHANATPTYGGGSGNALPFVNKNRSDKSSAKVVVTDTQQLPGKKKKWTGWSGFFRRNSKPAQQTPTVPDDSVSSDEGTGPPQAASPSVHVSPASGGRQTKPHATSEEANKRRHFLQHPPRNASKDRSSVVDSLSPLQSDLSASQSSLSRKERREAILARAQARRHNGGSVGGSSSDENDKDGVHLRAPSPSSSSYWRGRSQESLTSNGSASCRTSHAKSRTGRTERYLQRRSRDEDSLRREVQQQQQQQQSQSSRHASPSCADWSPSSPPHPSTSKCGNQRWLLTASSVSSIQGPRGGAHHPETTPSDGGPRVAESPVTLRKPTYGNNNNNSPIVGRAQSALVTHPKLATPPPPPPRNPLKKSYLLQVQSNEPQPLPAQSAGRPTSYSFGDLSRFGQQHLQQAASLHDYQNVDQDGRLVPANATISDRSNGNVLHLPVTSPVQRRVLNGSPQQRQPGSPNGRHHSAFFPSSAKSPSPFKSPEQERSKPPPWLASNASAMKPAAANSSAPPVREFWRSKEVQQKQQQQTPPTSSKSARERLAPFNLTANNGSVSSLNSDLSSPRSRDAGHNSAASPLDCPPFYMATGSALNCANGSGVIASTPRRFPAAAAAASSSSSHDNSNNMNNNQPHHVRELSQLKPSTDRHLEQAICELEQIYRSLKLDGDEDLLDRAERRDLPTVHQQLNQHHYPATAVSVCSGSESGGDPLGGHGITSDLDTMMNWSISGSFENLVSSNTTVNSERVRAPPNRRSAVPDKVADDMAVRRLAAAARKSQCNDPQSIAAQSGSYLLVSPSLTAAMGEDHDVSSRSGSFSPDEPDVIYDDVAYRQIRQANKPLRVAEPQPPFGIPLGPVTPASPSDYLHSSVTPEQMDLRPLLHPTKYPDLVRDDLAFRNLRKDAGQLQLPPGPVNTDKLDDLLQYVPHATAQSLKKRRAVRSLSANIGQLIRMDAARPSGGGGVVDFNRDDDEEDERYIGFNPFDSRAQSLSDLLDESPALAANNNNYSNANNKSAKTPRAVKQRSGLKRVGKSIEADDVDAIIQRQVRPMASWVERAQLSDVAASSTETITAERIPALAKLYPTSALTVQQKKSEVSAQPPDLEMDHLISELSECGAPPPPPPPPAAPGGRANRQVDSSGLQLALKPPTGFSSEAQTSSASPAAGHCWEESPLFQSQPQFHFTQQRSASPANSSDSGQVSCCAREVRQILHHQIRQEEKERERLASMASSSPGRKTSRTDPAGGELRTDKASASANSSVDRSVPLKSRPAQSTTATASATTPTARDNPAVRKSSGRRMSNNNEPGSAPVTVVEKRDERIARYKEERRKQLQAARQQAGLATGTVGHDHSSSSEDLPHEEQSYAKYKHRKQMQKQQLESRPLEESTTANIVSDVTNCNLSSTGIKRFIKRESPLTSEENNGAAPVRINRAARLRAAATSGTPPPVEDKMVVQRAKRLSVPLMEMPPIDPSGGPVDNSQPAVVVLRQKLPSSSSSSSLQAGNREKDKSTKRKSNLNRALTDEQILATGQIESQEDAGKRVRRRRTADLTVSASSAETDMNSSVDNAMIRRMETASRHSPQPAADLRAHLRKTSQPPAFIRPVVPEMPNSAGGENVIAATAVESSSSVPWRTGKVASADKAMEPIRTEDLTARIEALTAMAHQTVAKVDRLTATPDRESNGAHPASAGGSVKAVATKLLNRVANIQPTPVSPNLPVSLPRRPAKIESPNVCVHSNSSPAVKLLPAAVCTQQQKQQPQPQTQSLSKNKPAVQQADKTAAASPAGVAAARANTANASALGRSKTADQEKTQSKPVEPVGNGGASGPSSSVKAVQGILKKKVEGGAEPSVVRIRPEVSPAELYPILRVEEENVTPLDPVSILKKRFEADAETLAVSPVPAEASAEPHSILKRPLSRDGSAESARSQSPVVDPINSILKRASLTSSPGIIAPDQVPGNSEPRPILKKRCSTEDAGLDGPRPILKKKSSTEEEHELAAHKPILKSGRRTSPVH
ncbi:uncharacterized protein LOC116934274 isoform X3 [Daphnia magna]|nr:uncharacterized protein LOC116934274 isoform X3 [Daphnia magna]XP_045032782.1 uncharacterized protein LOC116934274 isoform X3 [Daphnia magna]XP_045032783.1 uncharacterized protein LOC116934274 isoform X3 [Daphnia magna]XP_045032784.1 uncharacterized protein LOC116934274 isoform X3 [Daphnia magna]XP_045032785.1 uncharacterized protein LOC116934274 isoform X3 [Daphnia magna]XP_045032786.1 uncharacterized protein LOC116934274 isoform X3 [Daphnia magna]XP_045032787.1 uncharacterized protein LO